MDKVYLQRRGKKNYTSHRLSKRTDTIIDSLKEYIGESRNSVLDIGTADGQMIRDVINRFDLKRAFGIDISEDAIKVASRMNGIRVAAADFMNLPFKDGAFDVVVASAVIEHIENIGVALKEAHRVLRSGGVLCVTFPNPVYDWINSKLIKTYHVRRYSLRGIMWTLKDHGFEIVKAGYFMLWPFGKIIFEERLERFLRRFKLDFLLFNQITLVRKA